MQSNQQTQIKDLPLGRGVRVLVSNEHGLVALEKPAGLLSHPNRSGEQVRCLLQAEYDYDQEVYTWKVGTRTRQAWLLNRLDSPTSGVVLLALENAIVPVVRQLFTVHKVQKTYYAWVKNAPLPKVGSWKDSLKQSVYGNHKNVSTGSKIFAQTDFRVMEMSQKKFPIKLLKLMPLTGRTHQLRIQCQLHKHPIIGDQTYGDFVLNRKIARETGEKRMFLHAKEIALNYTLEGKVHHFKAVSESPEAFNRFRAM